MRQAVATTALVLTALLLSGCTLPGDEEAEETPAVFGACPHWKSGPGLQAFNGTIDDLHTLVVGVETNATDGAVARMHGGRALDMFAITVNATGGVELRVFALRDGGAERLVIHHIEDGTWRAPPFLEVQGKKEVQVFLADTAFEAGTDPAPLRIQLEPASAADVTVDVVPFYRVCGIPLQDPTSVP